MLQTTHQNVTPEISRLADFIMVNQPLFVLTGAGCSTDSGIPDYRDASCNWKHSRPVNYDDFIRNPHCRKRYWARSMLGWRHIAGARPNDTHTSLARLEAAGFITQLVTQNVDGLHQQAGSISVLELHGKLDSVICLDCNYDMPRTHVQSIMQQKNPGLSIRQTAPAPDGDSSLDDKDINAFQVPECSRCGGTLKPDVVFFGENVPRSRVHTASQKLQTSKGMLIVGSSLMLYSGYRFCRLAISLGIPVAAVNLGITRADRDFALKISGPSSLVLPAVAAKVAGLGNADRAEDTNSDIRLIL